MKHLIHYNEGLFDRLIKKSKKDLYISKCKFINHVNAPLVSDKFYGISFQDLDLSVNKIIGHLGKGVFTKSDDYFRPYNPYKFGEWYDGQIWFEPVGVFDKLRSINDELGYKIGSTVFVKPLNKNSTITNILNGCLYHIYVNAFTKGIDYKFTLFYEIEGDSNKYQIGHLELIKEIKKSNIVDSYIKDIFSDLIDDDKINYVVEKKFRRDIEFYSVKIISTVEANPSFLSLFFRYVDSASRQLLSEDLKVKIINLGIEHGNIKFEFEVYA